MCRFAKFSHTGTLSWMQTLHVCTKDSPREIDRYTVPSLTIALVYVSKIRQQYPFITELSSSVQYYNLFESQVHVCFVDFEGC